MLSHKKNLIFSLYVIILTVVCPLIFWLVSRPSDDSLKTNVPSKENPSATNNSPNSEINPSISKLISSGEKLLITADTNADKEAGIAAFAAGDFQEAIVKFKSSLATNRNDPETWIYLNNATAKNSGNFIKIASSIPIGGNLNVAKEILRGVAQAQDEINQNGGVAGKLLVVEIANDNNDVTIAKQIASEFVKDTSILAVVGHNSSDVTQATAPTYQQGKLVVISPTSVASNLSGIGNYVFRTTPSARVIASTLARYAVESAHKKKIAICADSQAQASRSFQEEFILETFARGGKISKVVCDFSNPSFDPNTIPAQVISDGADALLLAPSIDKVRGAIDVARASQGKLTLFGSQAIYVFESLQEGQGDVNGIVLSVVWHPDAFPNNRFSTNSQKMWGGGGSWRTATAYDATEAILAGLKTGQTRQQLQKTLSDSNFSIKGALGDVKFQPSGDRFAQGILVKIQPGKASGTGYDFVPLK
jgi:branched-chain amino acid transport system substrate-binding protein